MRDVTPTDRSATPATRAGPSAAAPPTPSPAPPAGTSPPPPPPPPAVQLAASLAQLIGDGTLQGTVTGRDPHGWPVLHTDSGDFALAKAPQLPAQSRIVLQLTSIDGHLAQIIRTDGSKLATPLPVELLSLPAANPLAQASRLIAQVAQTLARLPSAPTLGSEAKPHGPYPLIQPQSGSAPTIAPARPISLEPIVPPTMPPAAAGAAGGLPSVPPGAAARAAAVASPVPSSRPGAEPVSLPNPTVVTPATTPAGSTARAGPTLVSTSTNDAAAGLGKAVVAVAIGEAQNITHGPGIARIAPPPVGTDLTLTLRSIVRPEGNAATAPPWPAIAPGTALTVGMTLHAVVASRTVTGHSVLQSLFGSFMLMAEPMAPGTRILADVNAIHLPAPPPTVAEAIPIDVALRLKRNWPALQEVIDVLRSIDPAAAQKFIATAVPQSGPKLAAGALLFLAALRGGSVENWLGAEPLRLLAKAGRADLARRLGDDFTQAAQLASDPTKGDWRVLLLPIYDGEAMRQVTFFFRHGGKSPGRGSERDTGTRFVVDLDLDATGALQFDGLVRKHQFDLIMRSVRPLAEEWRRDIATIFGDALAISGMKGGVTFQVGAARQTPLDDMRRNASHGTVTV